MFSINIEEFFTIVYIFIHIKYVSLYNKNSPSIHLFQMLENIKYL